MQISVVGTGYLGATHAACLAAVGHQVVGIDNDSGRIGSLQRGQAPFHENGLNELLVEGLESGRLSFSTALEAARDAEVHFLCVGTPQQAGGQAADLSALDSVVDELLPLLGRGSVVVGKSTVPVGTAQRLARRVALMTPVDWGARVAWNPEFLREGHAVADSLHPDRIVLGVEDGVAERCLREVYAPMIARGVPVVRTDLATAELAKVSANVMLAARISLVNLLAEVCEASGADVGDLTRILGLDERIGPQFLRPGIGFGGGCLPKDTRAFAARAEELGVREPASILHAVDSINMWQRARTVDRAVQMLGGGPAGRTVAALGAAFKGGSDDLRDSPALDVASTLHARGARIRIYDPQVAAAALAARPGLEVAGSAEEACQEADIVLVLTDWEEFGNLDPVALGAVVAHPRVLDGRMILDPEKWQAAGWEFQALGRGR